VDNNKVRLTLNKTYKVVKDYPDCSWIVICNDEGVEVAHRRSRFIPAPEPEVKSDHIVDKHEMIEPQPIKVDIPECVYCYIKGCDFIKRLNKKSAHLKIENDEIVADFKDIKNGTEETCKCYRTWSEAVSAAGWNSEK
jgi:hypothetical protein